jgi:hypothetical protein
MTAIFRLIAAILISLFYLLIVILLLLAVLPFIALKTSLQCMQEYQAIRAAIDDEEEYWQIYGW